MKQTLLLVAIPLVTICSTAQAQTPTTAEEQYLIDLINAARAQSSLAPLEVDQQLVAVARGHSYEMASRWFFSHDSPTTGDVHSRLRTAGVAYSSASENIAYERSPWEAHAKLMRYAPNREVLLSPEFTHVGVGIIPVGRGLMITENFVAAAPSASPWGGSWSQLGRALTSPWGTARQPAPQAARPQLASPWNAAPQAAAPWAPQPQSAAPQVAQAEAAERERRSGRRLSSRHEREPQQCALEGSWQGVVPNGMLRGRSLTFDFWQNGQARGTAGSITLDTRWARQGDQVSLTDIGANPSMAACPASQVGQYSLAFGPDCNTVQVVSSADSCGHRNQTLQGLQARRVR